MYSKEEEIRIIYNLLTDYMNHQQKAIELFSSGNWAQYQSKDVVVFYQTKLTKCMNILNSLKVIMAYFNQAYSEEQLLPGGIADKRAEEGRRLFSDLRKDPDYVLIMSEIAHNSYFNGNDSELSGIMLPENMISDHLENRFKSGAISKEQLILYDNYFTFLINDQEYNANIQRSNEGMSR